MLQNVIGGIWFENLLDFLFIVFLLQTLIKMLEGKDNDGLLAATFLIVIHLLPLN